MKKKILKLLRAMKNKKAALVLALLALFTASVNAGGLLVADSLINNGMLLCISNNVTITNNTAGPYFYSYGAGTNIQSLYTNSVNTNLVYNSWEEDVRGPFVDGLGNVSTNAQVMIQMGSTNLIKGPNQSYINGPFGTNYTPMTFGLNTAAMTNTIIVTLLGSVDGVNYPDNGDTSKKFVFQLAAPGVGTSLTVTNLPASFLTGTKSVTCWTVSASSATASPGVYISQLKLVHFVPSTQ